jgi:hypothetical protein
MKNLPTVRSEGYRIALVVDGETHVMTRKEALEFHQNLQGVLAETKPPVPPTAQKSTLAA